MKQYSSVLVIYNPDALKGKIEQNLPHIKQRLSLRYTTVEMIASKSPAHTQDVACKNAGKYDIILAAGGDGTLHNVINGVARAEQKCIVGVLPFGTCNDVARTLNIPRDLDKSINAVLRLNTTKYDIMFDGEQYIAYSLASGYLTSVSFKANQKTKSKIGRMAYVWAGLGGLFKLKALPFTFDVDGTRMNDKFVYVMLINGRSAGGFEINKNEDIANGKIKFVAIKKTKGLGAFCTFVRMFTHGVDAIRKNKSAVVIDAKKVSIENPSNEPFCLDGEKVKFLTKQVQVATTVEIITN